jgi:uncharacterized membrane protein
LNTRFDARDLSLSGILAGLYVVLNFVQMVTVGNPTVYGPIQLRVADCLIALAALLGWPVVAGVTVGCVAVNAFGTIGPVDIVFGSIANLVAASLVVLLRKRAFSACVISALPIGIIVGGGYLWWFFPMYDILGISLPAWLATMISITISSLIAIAGIGYILLKIISKPSMLESLKSHGLKTSE